MQIGAVHVHGVTADDLDAHWLWPDTPDDTKVTVALRGDGPNSVSLLFDDRYKAARFFDAGVEQVATLPDKAEPDTDVPAELDGLSERTGIPADRLRQAYDTAGSE